MCRRLARWEARPRDGVDVAGNDPASRVSPAADAPAAVVAAWYERKATLLEHLAAEGNPHAARLAVEAHRHATDLLAAAHEAVAA